MDVPDSGSRDPRPRPPAVRAGAARTGAVDPGLCASCAHAKRIESARGSAFWLCGRAERDPGFRRYPPLPVVACPGHAPGTPAGRA